MRRFARGVCEPVHTGKFAALPDGIVGREQVKVRGVRFRRPLKLSSHQRREAIERLDAGAPS
jgi:hypothetical protein